jgi:hypothetical protein
MTYHDKSGLGGKQLSYNIADYWLYGGLGQLSTKEREPGEDYREVTLCNLTVSQPEYEPLSGVVKRPHKEEVAKTANPVVIKKRKRTVADQRKRKQALQKEREMEERQRSKN